MASTYTWKQDNGTATISVLVPFDTAHSDLRLLLSRRRFTLEQRGAILLQRRLFGAIDPRRTRAYTMHEYSGAWNEVTLARRDRDMPHNTCVHARNCLLLFVELQVRVTIFKDAVAGWSAIFLGDAPRQHLQRKIGQADAKEAADAEARRAAGDVGKGQNGLFWTALFQRWQTTQTPCNAARGLAESAHARRVYRAARPCP